MNYIYDILINYDSKIYDFYEWNKDDYITHIRKIPLFKFDTNILYDLVYKNVKINQNFLCRIYNRTEKFVHSKTSLIDYCFLGTDGKEVVAFKLDKNGYIKMYSKLLIEEEIEILEYSKSINNISLDYEILSSKSLIKFNTREEIKIKSYLIKEINNMIKNNDYDKLHYLYLDCFEKKLDTKKIIKNIYEELDNNWDNVYLKMYNILTLVRKNENR